MAIVQLQGLPVDKMSAHFDVVYWSYFPNPLPPHPTPTHCPPPQKKNRIKQNKTK